MTRAISVNDLYTKKRKLMNMSAPFKELMGTPEHRGSWIIWGDSFNGKTSFSCQLAKELSSREKLIYNSMEEGDSESLRIAFQRVKMEEVRRKITVVNESIPELKERLRKHKAAKAVIIDSVQYSDIKFTDYKSLLKEFPEVLFIWVSHEDGKLPEGRIARRIRYDSPVKIRVVGFKAFASSRYGGGNPYVIAQSKADEYWAGGLLDEKKIF